jgi:hypothetical protein
MEADVCEIRAVIIEQANVNVTITSCVFLFHRGLPFLKFVNHEEAIII